MENPETVLATLANYLVQTNEAELAKLIAQSELKIVEEYQTYTDGDERQWEEFTGYRYDFSVPPIFYHNYHNFSFFPLRSMRHLVVSLEEKILRLL